MSVTTSINTASDSRTVMFNPIFSPLSTGSTKVKAATTATNTHGNIQVVTKNSGRLCNKQYSISHSCFCLCGCQSLVWCDATQIKKIIMISGFG